LGSRNGEGGRRGRQKGTAANEVGEGDMVQKKRCKGWANVGGARIHSEEAVDCSCVVAARGTRREEERAQRGEG
jgi:hypothetical protein